MRSGPARRAWASGASLGRFLLGGCPGEDQSVGRIEGRARPARVTEGRERAQREATLALVLEGEPLPTSQILFGDLHVHTTYSIDAFLYALPIFSGEGVHPPADACDFARYCSALDFFSINDHAEGLTPERWEATQRSLRACDARGGDEGNPDLVPFLGWEWTQVGRTPETHYGHKNVVLRGLDGDQVPTRPITSLSDADLARAPPAFMLEAAQRVLPDPYDDFVWWVARLAELPNCPTGVAAPELPGGCRENAPTPAELFAKLDQWGLDALVIPHGLVWGIHAPPGSRLDNQLAPGQHDPARQRLLEVYSGHGGGEEYRSWLDRPAEEDSCPAPSADFLPCCWQAGEIMRSRCGDLPAAECQTRVEQARRLAWEGGVAPEQVFPEAPPEAWLDCDQCRDCFKPALSPRAGESAQYGLALSRGETGEEPRRFRFGFLASSDDHHARAGASYKQIRRRGFTDVRGLEPGPTGSLLRRFSRGSGEPDEPQPVVHEPRTFSALLDTERTASFLYPAGLVAVHAESRDRAAIWDALARRRVDGTSGPRILLWFELTNGPAGREPMGAELELGASPSFEVRALGSFLQQPGCPPESLAGLSPERLERLCFGECYHPADQRHPITAIEVVRVRPQIRDDEPIAPLIEDPWLRFECPPSPEGCVVRFEDPEFVASGRDAAYYVRALQAPTQAINAANLRTEFDAEGNATRVSPCYGDDRTPRDDDCLGPVQERAWSSPIYVDQRNQPASWLPCCSIQPSTVLAASGAKRSSRRSMRSPRKTAVSSPSITIGGASATR
ncbi:MAG: DUF3604 domain-containing protein [Myxococcota bacterium]